MAKGVCLIIASLLLVFNIINIFTGENEAMIVSLVSV